MSENTDSGGCTCPYRHVETFGKHQPSCPLTRADSRGTVAELRALLDKARPFEPGEDSGVGRILTDSENALWNALEDGALADLLRVVEAVAADERGYDADGFCFFGCSSNGGPHAPDCAHTLARKLTGGAP